MNGLCKCGCGRVTTVSRVNDKTRGWIKGVGIPFILGHSCRTHGHCGYRQTSTYRIWRNMIRRCSDPKNAGWKYYGGRGIRVCERWKTFAHFLADMGERPIGLTLDRIFNDKGYEPGNCGWANWAHQMLNKRQRQGKPNGI